MKNQTVKEPERFGSKTPDANAVPDSNGICFEKSRAVFFNISISGTNIERDGDQSNKKSPNRSSADSGP
jgi:hypothetical protein